jgi:hypothetical protein
MGIQMDENVKSLLKDTSSRKAIASIDRNGELHLVFKGSITIDGDGNIRYFDLNETSQTNKNLTYSLWFNKKVTINVLGEDCTSYQIKGIPIRAIISGKEFEDAYIEVQERRGMDCDLSTIWIIEPTEVKEETFSVRQAEERQKYPLIGHLDRY